MVIVAKRSPRSPRGESLMARAPQPLCPWLLIPALAQSVRLSSQSSGQHFSSEIPLVQYRHYFSQLSRWLHRPLCELARKAHTTDIPPTRTRHTTDTNRGKGKPKDSKDHSAADVLCNLVALWPWWSPAWQQRPPEAAQRKNVACAARGERHGSSSGGAKCWGHTQPTWGCNAVMGWAIMATEHGHEFSCSLVFETNNLARTACCVKFGWKAAVTSALRDIWQALNLFNNCSMLHGGNRTWQWTSHLFPLSQIIHFKWFPERFNISKQPCFFFTSHLRTR